MELNLTIGDKASDSSLIILDEDRLCYKVRSISKGVSGVRTISKALLNEWVDAYKQSPETSAQVVRERLVGKSDIDRFEYGYASTLAKMAKMVLGLSPIIHTINKIDYKKEFIEWWCNIKKQAEKTAHKYISYLSSLNKPLSERKNSTWPGIYIYLFGKKAEKEVLEIGDSDEFERLYGAFGKIFDASGCPEGVSQQSYDECVKWVKEVSDWACLSSAFKAYREFLQWRKEQCKSIEEPLSSAVLQLELALQIFTTKRIVNNEQNGGWFNTGREVNDRIRKYFEPLTSETLQAFNDEKITELFCGQKDAEGKVIFEPMWSGKPGMGWGNIKPNSAEDTQKIVDFLVKLHDTPSVVTEFLQKGFDRPKGFGPSVISELLMKFHPKQCIKHGEVSHKALSWLGLIDHPWNRDFTDAEYKQVCGAAAKILTKMSEMKIPRQINADGSEDASPPDYLTVNEFLYFVDTNLEIIKEEVMNKQMRTEKPTKYDEINRKKLSFTLTSKDDKLLLRLLSALRAKPFAILAGHSGTGKSRYVKKLAYMTCNVNELRVEGQLPGNYLLLQVKPNWHDSTDLLGYRNALDGNRYQKTALIEFLFKAYHFKDTPFFLCLDEMNLAPVEQYFAEFLSAMESIEPIPLNDITQNEDNLFELGCEWIDSLEYLKASKFSIPKNLFIVGTVNMDETTNQFSRKVLDRAFTIEMTDVDFHNFGKVEEPSYNDTIEEQMIQALLHGNKIVEKLDDDDLKEGSSLINIQQALEQTAFAIAYRFANEYTLLKRAIEVFDPDNTIKLDALDQAVLMKILPRIAGEKDYIEQVYNGKDSKSKGLIQALEGKNASLEKIQSILDRANAMHAQYITFWP